MRLCNLFLIIILVTTAIGLTSLMFLGMYILLYIGGNVLIWYESAQASINHRDMMIDRSKVD